MSLDGIVFDNLSSGIMYDVDSFLQRLRRELKGGGRGYGRKSLITVAMMKVWSQVKACMISTTMVYGRRKRSKY